MVAGNRCLVKLVSSGWAGEVGAKRWVSIPGETQLQPLGYLSGQLWLLAICQVNCGFPAGNL